MVIVLLLLLGLMLGSFVNALVWRLHEQDAPGTVTQKAKKPKQKQVSAQDLSIMRGRSMCPACHHTLAAKDLVPVVSWVMLKGRCRYCAAPISWQYPLVELLTAALFAGSYAWWPEGFSAAGIFNFSLWLLFITAFVALAVYDIRWFLLPDRIVFPLIGLAVFKVLCDAYAFGGGPRSLIPAVLAVACTAGVFYVLYVGSRGAWIGFGDVKLAIVLGLLAAQPAQALLLVFIAALLGTVAAAPLLLRGRVKVDSHIPFGPFLLAATMLVVLFGGWLVGWYVHLLYLG